MDAEAETSYMYVYPSNHHFKTFWNTCIFHHVENWFPLSKKANLSDYYYQLTEGNCILSMYMYLYLNIKLIVKINILQKELCDNWTMLVHHYECWFCYCLGVHTRLHHGQHVPTTAVWGRKYFRWSRKGKLCPNNRRWLDQIPGRFNQGILLLLFFFNYL